MALPFRRRPAALGALALPLAALMLSACDQEPDFDLRGGLGAFNTADAASTATAARPAPDARGVISYPNYQVAVARPNDTVETIAARLSINPAELARFNGIEPGVPLRGGEVLALPTRVAAAPATAPGGVDIAALAGDAIDRAPATPVVRTTPLEPAAPAPATEPVRHKVTRGETAYTIARLYGVPVQALAEWNGLGPDFSIREGQFLLIPVAGTAAPARAPQTASASPRPTAVPAPGTGSPTPTPPSASTPLPRDEPTPAAVEPQTVPAPDLGEPTRDPSADARMAYPVQGRIIRDYSKGRNDGIDIAADPGSPVRAAADGVVAAITEDADGVPIIVVRHQDNLLSVYANLDGIEVNKNDRVARGQTLARLRPGDDAYVHFEVREGFDSVDPMSYLR